MEGRTGVDVFLGFLVFLGLLGIVGMIYIAAWRWMWKQRGIGLAQGWFTVVDQRARGEPAPPSVRWELMRGGEKSGVSDTAAPPGKFAGPDQGTAKPREPVRYLVPTERK